MPYYKAEDVMVSAAALLNDNNPASRLFDFDTQLPYLKIAQVDLEQELILNECPVSLMSEAIITVPVGDTELTLPNSFFLPIRLQERTPGQIEFFPMTEQKDIKQLSQAVGSVLGNWDFRHNCVNFIASSVIREVNMTYWRTLPGIISEDSPEYVAGGINPLAFRTAALCAYYIGGNKERHDSLNLEWITALDRLISIFTKNNQGNRVRRKPFRVGLTR